jgi:hydrogenase maturation protease
VHDNASKRAGAGAGEHEGGGVAVVGIGNILMHDDGIGPAVVHRLENDYRWDGAVELLDAGAPGMELAYLIEGRDVLILVDAVALDAEPGTLRWFDHDEIIAGGIPVRVGPHDPGIREAILKLELVDAAPRVVELLGVVPEHVDLGSGLTPAAQRGVRAAVEALVERLGREGFAAEPRDDGEAEPWWL